MTIWVLLFAFVGVLALGCSDTTKSTEPLPVQTKKMAGGTGKGIGEP
jgi:hypothetical protein